MAKRHPAYRRGAWALRLLIAAALVPVSCGSSGTPQAPPTYYVVNSPEMRFLGLYATASGRRLGSPATSPGTVEGINPGEDGTFYLSLRTEKAVTSSPAPTTADPQPLRTPFAPQPTPQPSPSSGGGSCATSVIRMNVSADGTRQTFEPFVPVLGEGEHASVTALTRDGARLAYLPDGCGGPARALTVLDTATRRVTTWAAERDNRPLQIRSLAWDGEGDTLAISAVVPCEPEPGRLCLPGAEVLVLDTRHHGDDLDDARLLRRLERSPASTPIAYSHDGKALFLATSDQDRHAVIQISAADGSLVQEVFSHDAPNQHIAALALDSSSSHLLVAATWGMERLDLSDGQAHRLPLPLEGRQTFQIAW
ncbi:YncE family protein [Nonomuraea wenchangensis]